MVGARRSKRDVALAIAVSLAAHLVVLGLLVPNNPAGPAPPQSVFEVEILPPPTPPEPRPRRVVAAASRPSRAALPDKAEPAQPVPTRPDGFVQPPAPVAPLAGSAPPVERRGTGGEGLVYEGCDPRRLASARERRDCDTKQMAQARLRPPPHVEDDLSQGGRFAPPDPLPYLARQPKKGCKPKAGGGQGMDTQDIPVIGIACVFHF
jgi:hypothetical protein